MRVSGRSPQVESDDFNLLSDGEKGENLAMFTTGLPEDEIAGMARKE